MSIEPYKRIPCGVYDQFELKAMRRSLVHIRYRDEASNHFEIDDTIMDLKSIDKVEYVLLKSGISIRLDWVLQLDDMVIQDDNDCRLS